MSDDRIGVVLMDDHAIVREGLRALLEQQSDIEIISEASSVSGAEALDTASSVIVADLVLPDGRGPEAVRRLHQAHPDAALLVLTMLDSPTDVQLSLAAGANGYLLKEAASTELVAAVRSVAAGGGYLQPSLGLALVRWQASKETGGGGGRQRLTDREVDVLRLIALGYTNVAAAETLHLSVRTVENHRANIMRKMGLHSRADLVRMANESGVT